LIEHSAKKSIIEADSVEHSAKLPWGVARIAGSKREELTDFKVKSEHSVRRVNTSDLPSERMALEAAHSSRYV
jgi:hypothetical protein